ncbi:MAG: TrbC/VirB2 family protein [Candidatus Pacebacteria bacterium]|nr:TrbC/VirB2 family protein [Candidatus Paceibacterota bacterium]
MKKNKKILIFTLFFSLVPLLVFGDPITIDNPLEYDSIEAIISAVVSFITMVAFAIAPIIFIWGGFKFFFAGGDPGKAKEATNLIKWAVIGLTIIIVANGIILVVKDVIGVEEADPDPDAFIYEDYLI